MRPLAVNTMPNATAAPRAAKTAAGGVVTLAWRGCRQTSTTPDATIPSDTSVAAPSTSPVAMAMTAAMAPSVATIGVTTLTSPSRTPSSQQPEPTTKPTPATTAQAHSPPGAVGTPSTMRATGRTAAAPIAIVQASVVRAPRMRAGRGEDERRDAPQEGRGQAPGDAAHAGPELRIGAVTRPRGTRAALAPGRARRRRRARAARPARSPRCGCWRRACGTRRSPAS